jgi:radical SAM protein (TIGR04043 family)
MEFHAQSQASQRNLITDLQSFGLRLADSATAAPGRRGGAGPSDHRAIILGSRTVMVPVYTDAASASPFAATPLPNSPHAMLTRDGVPLARIGFPRAPRFYAHETFDGVPYWKIAQLHGQDVLATTILQTCIRFADRATSCQFCAIGQSLQAGRTIARKTPEQLAEVARMAVLLDNVRHMVMTTGTPNVTDRGASILCDSAFAVKAAIDLPIQGQCEPPRDNAWFARMKSAGIDTLGMHLEAVTPEVRARIMPGKATVTIDRYLAAFAAAVPVFGRGQVSTYILAGLGDEPPAILDMCSKLVALGVYPFVVPFVPIGGTPLADHPPPTPDFMHSILAPLGRMLKVSGLRSQDSKAGCGKCGACSPLASYEA